MKYLLVLFTVIVFKLNANAQENFAISGTVKNEKGEILASASVFISGSEKATSTNAQGYYIFNGIASGTYQVVVNLMGYMPVKKNVILNGKPEVTDIILTTEDIALNEVIVNAEKQNKRYLKAFIKYFMGPLSNENSYKILNLGLVQFSTVNSILKAKTNDFLIIENIVLGYRISIC